MELKLYNLDEIANILQVTRRSMYNYVKSGKLPAVKIGKNWKVTEANLQRFLNGETFKETPTNIKNSEDIFKDIPTAEDLDEIIPSVNFENIVPSDEDFFNLIPTIEELTEV